MAIHIFSSVYKYRLNLFFRSQSILMIYQNHQRVFLPIFLSTDKILESYDEMETLLYCPIWKNGTKGCVLT